MKPRPSEFVNAWTMPTRRSASAVSIQSDQPVITAGPALISPSAIKRREAQRRPRVVVQSMTTALVKNPIALIAAIG
jgi:hypothetical protein